MVDWLCEVGPLLSRLFPGLPPLMDMSPRLIAAYCLWQPPQPDDEEGDDG